ncbi:MAG: transposase [Patescibacteria group bacterium]
MLYYRLEGPKPRFSLFAPTTRLLNQEKRIVDIICYCLMPNHFHFLLCQRRQGGITEFISKLSNSYTKYFNIRNRRIGPLFQGEFKAVHIESNEQLIHLSRYIHLNPLVGYLTDKLETYKWSSYSEFINQGGSNICSKEIILNQFKSPGNYMTFVLDQEDYGKQLELIKHQLIDFEHPQVQSYYTPGV